MPDQRYSRRGLCFVLLVVAVAISGCRTLLAPAVLPSEGLRPETHGVRIERSLPVRMDDGVLLRADVYRPQGERRAPTVLVRIPFSDNFGNRLRADLVAHFWAARGYNVVVQGTRGRFHSEGAFYPMKHERADGLATLEWLRAQEWFDGRLGMWGGSAFGQTQWAIADRLGSYRSALDIQIASSSFRTMFHQGGAFALESALFWAIRSHGEKDIDPSPEALMRGFSAWSSGEADDLAIGRSIRFYDDWLAHPEYDAYWEEIDGKDRPRNLTAPILLMAGWSDPFLAGQLDDFMKTRASAPPDVARKSRLIIGPWTHADAMRFPDGTTGPTYRAASLSPSIPWFDHHLKGEHLSEQFNAPIRLYIMGSNVWRDEWTWPLERTVYTPFYLHSVRGANNVKGDGALLLTRPSVAGQDRFVQNPRDLVPTRGGAMLGPRAGMALQEDVELRDDVLIYTTPALEEEVELTGPVSAVLYTKTSAEHADFTVKLTDVDEQGRSYNLTDGILRRRYTRDAGVHKLIIDLPPISMMFKRGHRIRVQIAGSNYPRFDRNPGYGDAAIAKPVEQRVLFGGDTPSHVVLPVIPVASSRIDAIQPLKAPR